MSYDSLPLNTSTEMDGAILLHDKVGEKTSSGFAGLVKRSTTVNVLRGELLVPVPGDEIVTRNDGEKPHNYRVKKKEAITMYCDPVNDVAPLGNYEFLLLEGIQSRDARYEVFLSGDKIDWGQTLKSGSDVYVIVPGTTFSSAAVPTQGAPRAAAKVRYVGGSGTEPGIMFGVEITVGSSKSKVPHSCIDCSFGCVGEEVPWVWYHRWHIPGYKIFPLPRQLRSLVVTGEALTRSRR